MKVWLRVMKGETNQQLFIFINFVATQLKVEFRYYRVVSDFQIFVSVWRIRTIQAFWLRFSHCPKT